jgi:hypothetical protein
MGLESCIKLEGSIGVNRNENRTLSSLNNCMPCFGDIEMEFFCCTLVGSGLRFSVNEVTVISEVRPCLSKFADETPS